MPTFGPRRAAGSPVVLGDGAQGTRLKLSTGWRMDGCPWQDWTDDDVEARTAFASLPETHAGHIPHDPGASPPMTPRHARDLARLSIVGGLLVALLAACGGSGGANPSAAAKAPASAAAAPTDRPIDRSRITGRARAARQPSRR